MTTSALSRVALQLWIVLFIVFFGAEVIHLEPGLRVVTQVLYGIPLAVWALLRLRGPADRLDWAAIGLLAIYAAVCLVSRDRTESLGTLGLATAYAAWFLLMRRAGTLRGPIVLAVSTGLALTLAFNAYLLIREKIEWYVAVGAAPLEGLVTFPWESVNTLPVLVLIAVPFVAWLDAGPLRTFLAAIVGATAVVVIPLSNGRAGYAGLAVAALILGALHPATGGFIQCLPRGRLASGALGIVIVVLVSLVVAGPRFVDALGTSGRLLIWEQGLNMIGGSPLVGSGPGTYSWVRMEFLPAAADLLALRLLHNVALLTLVEGGVVLFVGAAAALAAWGSAAIRSRRDWTWPERFTVAALTGFAAASLLDDFSFLPAVIAAILALAAFLVPVAPGHAARGWLMPALFAVAAIASIPSVIGVDVARGAAQGARTAMVNGEYADAVAGFEVATRSHPESGGYWLGLGMAYAYAGDANGAIIAYQRSTEVAPGDPRGYSALAHLGGPDQLIDRLVAAAERTLDDPQDDARLGLALAMRGDIDAATHAWGSAVALRSDILRLLPYDTTGISMLAVAAEAVLAIHANPRPAPYENEAALSDIALALDELPAGAGPAWRTVDAARHGDLDAADALAGEAIDAAPFDARTYQAVAAVAAFACDAAAEEDALALERLALGAYAEPEPEPRALREFVYREASLGPSQPPGAGLDLAVERWPWSLVDRPDCDQ